MNAAELVQEVYSSLEQRNSKRALGLLADDFVFSGATPVPLDKHQWVGVVSALTAAMPDFSFNYRLTRQEGSMVEGTVTLTGTQTRELVLPMPGAPRVPATGKKVDLPREKVELDTRDGQVISLKVESVPNGGVPGILQQLGASLPEAH